MINYTEKGQGLHAAIRAAGHSLREENGVWISSDDATVQALIDGYDPLPAIKADRNAEIKADGLARIQAVFPAIGSFDELHLVREQWLSIKVTARGATADFQRMIDIYTAGRDALTAVNAATTAEQVAAVAPAWPV